MASGNFTETCIVHLSSTQIFLDDYLVTGAQYILNIKFDGTMKDPSDQDGLYWASYVSILDGSTK